MKTNNEANAKRMKGDRRWRQSKEFGEEIWEWLGECMRQRILYSTGYVDSSV